MAKKKKDLDDNQDEFNENSGNEFGDDDENFGLPDLEYEPLDRDKEEEEKEEEPIKEEKPKKTTRKKSTKKEKEPDFAFSDTSEEPDEPETSPEDFNLEYDDVNEPPPVETNTAKKEESKSMAPIIITLVVLVVLIGGILGYIFWYAPMQEQKQYDAALAEGDDALNQSNYDAAIEAYKRAQELRPAESYPSEQLTKAQNAKNAAIEKKRLEDEAAAKKAEEERLAAEAAAAKARGPEPGTVERLTARTGRYYVVVSSSVDGDLAWDFANRIAKNGVGVQVLSPVGNVKFHRVTILSRETYNEAQTEADNLKAEYRNAWVVKY